MNAYRKIKFTTPGQLAAQLLGICFMFVSLLAIIILFI